MRECYCFCSVNVKKTFSGGSPMIKVNPQSTDVETDLHITVNNLKLYIFCPSLLSSPSHFVFAARHNSVCTNL